MDRFVLTDAQWAKMEPLCLGKPGDPGRSGKDNRRFVEAVLWIARTGSPWRDLPRAFGHWNSVYTRFRDWVKADVWKRLFDAVSDEGWCRMHRDLRPALRRGIRSSLDTVDDAALHVRCWPFRDVLIPPNGRRANRTFGRTRSARASKNARWRHSS